MGNRGIKAKQRPAAERARRTSALQAATRGRIAALTAMTSAVARRRAAMVAAAATPAATSSSSPPPALLATIAAGGPYKGGPVSAGTAAGAAAGTVDGTVVGIVDDNKNVQSTCDSLVQLQVPPRSAAASASDARVYSGGTAVMLPAERRMVTSVMQHQLAREGSALTKVDLIQILFMLRRMTSPRLNYSHFVQSMIGNTCWELRTLIRLVLYDAVPDM